MRTLKKTLSLVLVLAMVMSCGIFASADLSDFPDADEVQNTVAVGAMTGMGIIKGDEAPDGTVSFNPTGTLTRAQACVILTRMLGAEDIAVGTAPFTDMEGYDWAEGAIAYCAAEGIVDGVGDGKFNPGGELTGYAWAKMLLGAIGYDAQVEGMTGASWEIGVAKLAKAEKLFGADTSDKTAPVSRDNACAYAWNALQVGTRTYTVSGSNVTIGDINISASKTLDAARGESLGSANFGLTDLLEAETVKDEYGRPYAYCYTNGLSGKNEVIYYSEIAEPVYTSTTTVKAADLVKALGKDAKVDGEAPVDLGGNGTVTEIYATATKGEYKSVTIETEVWVLAKADIVAANAKTETKAGILLGADNLKWETEDEYAEGDVVLYTVGIDGKVASAELAPYITGAVTATATGYVRVNGDVMKLAANNDGLSIGSGELVYVDGKTEIVIYTDKTGYIVATDTIDNTPAAVPTDYIYVIEYQAIGGKDGSSDLFGETAGEAAAAKAKVLDLESGEVKVIDLAVTTDKNGAYVYALTDGSASDTAVTTGKGAVNAVYEYAVLEDGTYALTGDAVEGETATVKKGVASVAGLTATSKTVLKVVSYSVDKQGNITGAEISTTTGIANFPKDGKTYTNAIISTDRSGKIVTEILVVEKKVVADEVIPATYAVYLGEGEMTDVQYYAFSIDGETVNYAAAKGYSFSAKAGDIVTIELTNGKLSDVTVAEVAEKGEGAITYIDETFVIVNGQVFYFADAYGVINANDGYAVDSIAVEDYVELYVNGDGEVEFIVITEAPED